MKKRVVIADDEAIVRMDIREMLEAYNYEVVGEASDGIDAVELCKKLHPDLLLIDIKMPIMDGLTASRLIHEQDEQIAIIVLTAYNNDHFIEKAVDYGSIGYIVKPINESSLIPAIRIATKRVEDMNKLRKELLEQKKKLEDRKMIDRAKGILNKSSGMGEEEAYGYLRTISMKKRLTIREVAEMIVNSNRK